MSTRTDLLKNKGRVWVFDERASVKAWVELSVVDNVRVNHPANPVEVKTPSGITIYKSVDLDAQVSFDLYHPGNLGALELLYRGVVTKTDYDGSTAVAGEDQTIRFSENNEAHPLLGFDGDKSVVTVNSVKSKDGATTYTATTDYTIAVDSVTGVSHVVHVSTGSIPLDTDIVVDYDYTPLEGGILRPDDGGVLRERHIIIDSFGDCGDPTKYRRYMLPHCTIESEMIHSMLEMGEDNASPNIMPVTLSYAKPDSCSTRGEWRWIDTINV